MTIEWTKANHAALDALGKRYMQMLRVARRGDVCAWMTCGCIVAAEAFSCGLSDWHKPWKEPKVRGIDSSEGSDCQPHNARPVRHAGIKEAHQSHA
jgi:hypothetical protein